MKLNELSPEEKRVILYKGTEPPFTGKYDKYFEDGTYVCRQCGTNLYNSGSKFNSGCGWPSFDEEIKGSVKRHPDADGRRTEILCAMCGGHLGHVFEGEGFTEKNTRHCVNSISVDFLPSKKEENEFALLGGGCFWCLEAVFSQLKGVSSVISGYAGGITENPDYNQVCSGKTGHAEVIKIIFDPSIISYELLLEIFFSVHDPTTPGRQGNDIGPQYRSIILYNSASQKRIAGEVISRLEKSGRFKNPVVTELKEFDRFYIAEDYHQQYFFNNPYQPYCRAVISPKVEKFVKNFKEKIRDKEQ